MRMWRKFVYSPLFIGVLIWSMVVAPVRAEPTEPFAGASVAFDTAPPEPTSYNTGDWGVSEQRGAAIYTLPIAVPSGRNGMAPSLALRYSSQSSLRGGIAVGWTLDTPVIEIDRSPGYENGQAFYMASLGSASGPLVEVPDHSPYLNSRAYRVRFDQTFTRFFHIPTSEFGTGPPGWLALTPDGVRHYFAHDFRSSDFQNIWNITRQEDPFGNVVDYIWEGVPALDNPQLIIDHRLERIEYTANANAELAPHAKIEFSYGIDLCAGSNLPIGADVAPGARNRGDRLQGTQRLDALRIAVRDTPEAPWRLSKEVQFTYTIRSSRLYDQEPVVIMSSPDGTIAQSGTNVHHCNQMPLRYLSQVQTTAYAPDGSPTALPPTTFNYNMRTAGPYLSGPSAPSPGLPGLPGLPSQPSRTIDTPGFAHYGDHRGASGTLLDLDGDGILDRVSIIEENRFCTLVWQKGQSGGAFEPTVHKALLPTAPWYRETLDPPQPQGALLPTEGCNLNGQVAYRPRQVVGGDPVAERGMLAYRFVDYTSDGRLDLLTTVWAPGDSHDSYAPKCPSHWSICPSGWVQPASHASHVIGSEPGEAIAATAPTDFPGAPLDPVTPLLMTPEKSGLEFISRVYRSASSPNAALLGDEPLAFAITAMTLRTAVPLPPSISDEKLDHSVLPNSLLPVLIDLDGDGFLDIIDIGHHPNRIGWHTEGCRMPPAPPSPTGESWCVHFGNGSGEFSPGYNWPIPPQVLLSQKADDESTGPDGRNHQIKHTVALLRDINGNGLADLVVHVEDNRLLAYLNRGNGFATEPLDLQHTGPVESFQTDHSPVCCAVMDGNRGYRRRLVDLDGDGLPDLVYFVDVAPSDNNNIQNRHRVMVAFNAGDRFLSPVRLPVEWNVAKRHFNATSGDWRVLSDFFDITGDGHADMVTWTSATRMEVAERPGLPFAPDLLSRVENGRGMQVRFTYGSTGDPAVVAGNPRPQQAHLPGPRWVVTQVRVTGGHNTPPLVRRYHYEDPIFLSTGEAATYDESARFLGFRRTTVTRHSEDDAIRHRARQTFLYQDATGRILSLGGLMAEQRIYAAQNGPLRLHQHVQNTWQRSPVFGGLSHFVHLDTSLTRTCQAHQSETECVNQTDNVLRRQPAWSPQSPLPKANAGAAGAPQLYVRAASTLGSGLEPGPYDRRTIYPEYQIRYGQSPFGPDDYRVLVVQTDQEHARPGESNLAFERHGRTRITYDESTGLPIQTDRYQDETTIASTKRAYNPQTGNLISRIRPVQAASGGSGAAVTVEYDPHHLFVTRTTNELGHEVHTFADVATGALLERRGPNSVMQGQQKVFEQETWTIDGLGRTLEHHVSMDDGNGGYALHLVSKLSYHDLEFVEKGEPVFVRQEHLRDFGDDVWLTGELTIDGLGRVLTEKQFLGGGQEVLTVYVYDDVGNLTAVETPDPRTDDGARVRYTFDHDGLSRLIHFTRPDGNGLSMVYDGLERTVREETGDGSGSSAKRVYDVFGRLVEVHEFDPAGETALTRYGYDANNNLSRITDADGNSTQLEHDWFSNRVAITRGARAWRYTYDLNNNLIRELSPAPLDQASEPYTVELEYDDLDRMVVTRFYDVRPDLVLSPSPHPELSEAHNLFLPTIHRSGHAETASSLAASSLAISLEAETIRHFYDEGVNGMGRLTRVQLPFGEILYAYEARGLLAVEERSFELEDLSIGDTQRVERAYNALGLPTLSTWEDGQQWRITYDARGLVDTVDWFDPQAGQYKSVADYDRSLAGLPRSRNSAFDQVRQYTYDELGRPTGDTVLVGGAPIATRAYLFTDAGNLAGVTGETNGFSAAASYTYDARHRIKSASGPNGYEGEFSYSLAGNLLTASVTWTGSTETRHVRYEYGAVDPQAVDRLVNVGDGEVYADFAYDLSGNMTARNASGEAMALHWNGLDQLRLVDGSNGVELYYYDHSGMRMLAVSESEVRFWFAERETHYDLAGSQTRRYLHLSGGSALARVENGAEIELQYADALQNLMFSLDAAGNVAASFLYGPFGEVVHATGEEDHRRQFNGKEHDRVSGLRYYGFRYYDPLVLRWNAADPLYHFVPDLGAGRPQHMNLYSFSLNNPVRFFDPDGRFVDPDHQGGDMLGSDELPDHPADRRCPPGSEGVGSICFPTKWWNKSDDEQSNSPEQTSSPEQTTTSNCDTACEQEKAKAIAKLQQEIDVLGNVIDINEWLTERLESLIERGEKDNSLGNRILGGVEIVGGSIGGLVAGAACLKSVGATCAAVPVAAVAINDGYDRLTRPTYRPLTGHETREVDKQITNLQEQIRASESRMHALRSQQYRIIFGDQ